ncbi:hypothetical protein CFOL_v3_34389, partial [Cephalotus follicularis]
KEKFITGLPALLAEKNYYKEQIEKPQYYKKPLKRKKTFKPKTFQKTNFQNTKNCYNCGKPRHIIKYCKIRKLIKKLYLSKEHKNQLFKIINEQNSEEETECPQHSDSSRKIQPIK